MTSLISPQAWDVWLAYVRFADHPEIGKVRPVVILENNIVAVIAAKVTTAGNDENSLFCELKDWAVEGLRKPSHVPSCSVARDSNARDSARSASRPAYRRR